MNCLIFRLTCVVALALGLSACSSAHRNQQGAKVFFSPVSQEEVRRDLEDYIKEMTAESEADVPVFSSATIIPLPLNEELVYKVKWLGLTVGTVKISIKDLETIQGRPAYMVEALAETAGFFRLWPVRDRFVTYMDAENLAVLRHEVYRREGKYKKDAIVNFDHAQGLAHYQHLLDGTNESYDIPSNIHDALTLVYYFRANNLEAGDRFNFTAYADEKNYEVSGEIHHDNPIKISGIGVLPAYFVAPEARYGDELVSNGSAHLYVSADAHKIPLKAVVRGPVFSSITLTLEQINRKG